MENIKYILVKNLDRARTCEGRVFFVDHENNYFFFINNNFLKLLLKFILRVITRVIIYVIINYDIFNIKFSSNRSSGHSCNIIRL